jgi:hypothetical protein
LQSWRRVSDDREAEDAPVSITPYPVIAHVATAWAGRDGRMAETTAGTAALKAQFTVLASGPEARIVLCGFRGIGRQVACAVSLQE